jgi:lauroyl/myristoyl acyltransferase
MVSYFIYRLASIGVRLLPRSVSVRVASFIAFFFYLFRPRIRANVAKNLAVLGAGSTRPLEIFQYFSRTIVDFLSLGSDDPSSLRERCRFTGTDNLDRILEAGRGAILCAPHQGPWEVAGAYLAANGYRIHTIALEHPSRRVTALFSGHRNMWGMQDYPPGDGVARLLDALRRGEIAVLLIDRIFSTKGMALRFFGKSVMLPQGHVQLAKRTGAPLIPCCCYYADDGMIEGIIGAPIDIAEESTEAAAELCLAQMERFIRAHPGQWFAFDHVWPEGADV